MKRRLRHSLSAVLSLLSAGIFLIFTPKPAVAKKPRCPASMISVNGQFCIDPFEAGIEEKIGRRWVRHSPYELVAGKQIRAVSRRNVFPQAHISRNEAESACKASGKILCPEQVWMQACQGTRGTLYPYGDTVKVGYCNDSGVSPLNHYYSSRSGPPSSAYGWGPMNDPRLNQLPGSLARTGAFRRCVTPSRVHDMVGNLHEWIDDPAGTFRGGYYLDTKINGEGCRYKTSAHNADYHDYSTGFRCCANTR